MRAILIAVPLALLAACSGGGADNIAADNAANAVAPAAADNASASAANNMAAMNAARPGQIQECIEDVRNEVPAGTNVDAFCSCTVDRMQGSARSERAAMETCAAEMGIAPRQ